MDLLEEVLIQADQIDFFLRKSENPGLSTDFLLETPIQPYLYKIFPVGIFIFF